MLRISPPSFFCGIDLGTTNSTVSVIRLETESDNPIEKLEVRPIYQYDENYKFDKNSHHLPSSIYFDLDNNRVFTGKYAKNTYSTGNKALQTIRSVKTRIGGESLIEIPKINNPENITYVNMVQCSAILLKTIRQSLNAQFNEEINEVVITVPAAFNTDERQATKNSALLAGFKTIEILDEPTAALLYYINSDIHFREIDHRNSSDNNGDYKLVYDIGGGTLDVSIARIIENKNNGTLETDIVVRSPRMDLGGDDFDHYLAAYFLSEFENARKSIEDRSKEEQSQIISRIVSQAEKEKIEMNKAIKSNIDNPRRLKKYKRYVDFEVARGMYVQDIVITKEKLDEIFSNLIHTEILKPIEESLTYADLHKEQISEVIITGGMSGYYAVEQALGSFFGTKTRLIPIDKAASVSKGAAIHHYNLYGQKLKRIKLNDRLADDIYIKVGNEFIMLISRTTLPNTSGKFQYVIPEDGLAELSVFLYYGTSNRAGNLTKLAGKFFPLKHKIYRGDTINIEWFLDKDKIILIKVIELDGNLTVEKDKNYSSEIIQNDFIKTLKINV
ncbi:MAG: Hsp70 family protein [Desulfamplus sp.]|nr:Hsp70 family protein [Desulfamplus sp.]